MAKRLTKRDQVMPAEESAAAPQVYVVVNPITYGEPEARREAGEEVTDVPAGSLPWLLGQGHIRVKGDS